MLSDIARAKINLTLQVLGRRDDGYHELVSLVAFARAGDTIELEPADDLGLSACGPFAEAIGGDNLILAAAVAARTLKPGIRLGRFRLIKELPVAAGLGGGSADAAAALRLIARANPGKLTETELASLARELGSDVSVCLTSQQGLIAGRGEKVTHVHGFPLARCYLPIHGSRLPPHRSMRRYRLHSFRARQGRMRSLISGAISKFSSNICSRAATISKAPLQGS